MASTSMVTLSVTGEVSMWLGRRSPTKQTYPGLLDILAPGGLTVDVSIRHTLVKEFQEEDCVPAAIAGKVHPVSTVSYTYENKCQFVFDLELPLDFWPRVADGEVQEFYLEPVDTVSRRCHNTTYSGKTHYLTGRTPSQILKGQL